MILKGLSVLFSTLVVGKIPWAPGTMGSILAASLWWFLQPLSLTQMSLWIALFFVVGWVATHFYEKWHHKHDPKEVVVDELIGMWIVLLAVPAKPLLLFVAFLLFRLFDIWKPFPVGWIDQKVPGALGTILDDVAAGIMARVVLFIFMYLGASYGFMS